MKYFLLIGIFPVLILAQTPRWIYRYDAGTPGSGYDEAYSLVWGQDNNIYAAGRSFDAAAGYEGFTVIGLTQIGSQRWVYRYNHPSNQTDWARAVVYGNDGNIYVTGKSETPTTSDDIIVVSLTPSGTERWVYRYNGPGNNIDDSYALVYGTDGNIYIAGTSMSSGSNYDFTVISLTSSGSERWVYRYDGPGNSEDQANSIVYGTDGNIYVAGYSFNNSNLIDFTVISLTPTGSQRWAYLYNGTAFNWDKAFSIVCGTDSNLYAAGYSSDLTTGRDFTVISLTTTGSQRWVYRYNSLSNSNDEARSIVCGIDGNLYATGLCDNPSTMQDFAVISLTSTGAQRWTYNYNGPANYNEEAQSIVYGSDGNIYTAGFISATTGTNTDFTAISLNSNGTQRWIYTYGGPGASLDQAHSVIYGADGNIYVAGVCDSSNYSNLDFMVVSLTSSSGIEEISLKSLPQFAFRLISSTFQNNNITFRLISHEPLTIELSLYNIQGKKISG